MSGLTGVGLAILFANHRECKGASSLHQELCFARPFITGNQLVIRYADLAQDDSIQWHTIGIYDCYKDQMIASGIFAPLVFLWSQDTLFHNPKVHRWRGRVGRWGGGRRVSGGRRRGVSGRWRRRCIRRDRSRGRRRGVSRQGRIGRSGFGSDWLGRPRLGRAHLWRRCFLWGRGKGRSRCLGRRGLGSSGDQRASRTAQSNGHSSKR
jgi:hypothetical protein